MWVVCPQGLLPPLGLLPPQPHSAAAQLPHAAAAYDACTKQHAAAAATHETAAQHGAAEHITANGAAQACLACKHHREQARTSLCRKNRIFLVYDIRGNPEYDFNHIQTLVTLRGLMIRTISKKLKTSSSFMDLDLVNWA